MVNLKEAWKSLVTLAVGGTGGVTTVVAPVLSGSYETTFVSIGLTALFIVLTAIGIKEVNKCYEQEI